MVVAGFLFGWVFLSFGIVCPLGRFTSDGDDDGIPTYAPSPGRIPGMAGLPPRGRSSPKLTAGRRLHSGRRYFSIRNISGSNE